MSKELKLSEIRKKPQEPGPAEQVCDVCRGSNCDSGHIADYVFHCGVPCPKCGGEGKIVQSEDQGYSAKPCPKCGGKGV